MDYSEKIIEDLKKHGLNEVAAFILRMHLPLSGIAANVLMGAEPFLNVFDVQVNNLYEKLRDRNALNAFINKLEQTDNEEK